MAKIFPRILAFIVAFTLTLALIPRYRTQAVAAEHIELRNDDLTVVSEPPLETIARHVMEIYPTLRDDLEATLGWKLKSKPVVRLVASKEIFEKMAGNPHFSAFAVPSEELIVVHVSPSIPLTETLRHELCHLFLHGYIRDSRLPKWLDEGVCQWVSGSLGEILLAGGFPDAGVALARRPIPLRLLAYSFPQDKDALALAYEESRRFVEYLISSYGKQDLLLILKHLAEGDEINQALSKTLSKPLETVEDEWLESVRSSGVWLIWVSWHLYDILFFCAAVLTIVAFILVIVHRRRRYAELEDEES